MTARQTAVRSFFERGGEMDGRRDITRGFFQMAGVNSFGFNLHVETDYINCSRSRELLPGSNNVPAAIINIKLVNFSRSCGHKFDHELFIAIAIETVV
jgi:hypothetical protein